MAEENLIDFSIQCISYCTNNIPNTIWQIQKVNPRKTDWKLLKQEGGWYLSLRFCLNERVGIDQGVERNTVRGQLYSLFVYSSLESESNSLSLSLHLNLIISLSISMYLIISLYFSLSFCLCF